MKKKGPEDLRMGFMEGGVGHRAKKNAGLLAGAFEKSEHKTIAMRHHHQWPQRGRPL